MANLRGFTRFLAAAGLCVVLFPVWGNDWPGWRGPTRDGISTERGWSSNWPAEGPKQLWQAEVGIGFSSLTVADGRVFTLGNTNEIDTVWCLGASDGKVLWRHDYPCPLDATYYEGGPGSTPTVAGGRVYVLSKRGLLLSLDGATGRPVWEKNLAEEVKAGKPRWGFAGSPVVSGDRLILNVGETGTAVSVADGRVLWKSGTNFAGYATPVLLELDRQPAALIFGRKSLAAVNVGTGEVYWQHPWVTRWDINAADPVGAGNRVFLSTFDRAAGLLDLNGVKAPTEVWTNRSLATHFSPPVFLNGYLYGIDGNSDDAPRDLRCIELATGRVRWRQSGLGLGGLIAADGKLIVLGEKGELAVIEANPKSYVELARAQVLGGRCWSTPVLANGRIYCRNAHGRVVCVDVARR